MWSHVPSTILHFFSIGISSEDCFWASIALLGVAYPLRGKTFNQNTDTNNIACTLIVVLKKKLNCGCNCAKIADVHNIDRVQYCYKLAC